MVKKSVLILAVAYMLLASVAIEPEEMGAVASGGDSLAAYINWVKLTLIGRYGMRFRLGWDGYPKTVEGDLSNGIDATDPLETVYQFFEANKDIYKLVDPRRELLPVGFKNGIEPVRTIKLRQVVDGVRVNSRGFVTRFGSDKKLCYVDGQIDPDARQVNTTPAISEERAKEIAVADQRTKRALKPSIAEAELLIGRFDNKMRLVWHLGLTEGVGVGSWYYYIDAHSGKVMQVESAVATDF